MLQRITMSLAVFFFALSSASAHYLWMYVDNPGSDKAVAHLVFEEAPRPGDGKYLDPFIKRGKFWLQALDDNKPAPLKMPVTKKPGKRWLSTPISVKGPLSVTGNVKWGVYPYGKINVLLHYNAQFLNVNSAEQMKKLGRAEHLKIDGIPEMTDGMMKLRVLWQGKPAANRPVYVRGPKFNRTFKTDADGVVSFRPEARGRYTIRTYVELIEAGKFEGKAYQRIRHHFTLTMTPPAVSAN